MVLSPTKTADLEDLGTGPLQLGLTVGVLARVGGTVRAERRGRRDLSVGLAAVSCVGAGGR